MQVQRLHNLRGHNDAIYSLQPSDTSHLFFSAAGDGMVASWDLREPEHGELIARLPNSIYALHYFAAHDTLIAGHNYEGIHMLDWKNKKEIGSLQLTKAAVFDIQAFGDTILVATGDGSLHRIDPFALKIMRTAIGSEKSARCIAVNPLTGDIAVGFSDNHIRLYDENLILVRSWLAHANSVFTLRYTPDGMSLLSGSRDARLKVWDVNGKYTQAAEVVAHLYAINHLDFSPDGKHFVTCSMDKTIKVWDAVGMRLLKVIDRARHAGHGTSVNKVLWTPFNNQVVSASDDRSISIWQVTF